MALAVALGAFGSHALGPRLSAHYMDVYKTASLYHFIHGLGWIGGLLFLDKIGAASKNFSWIMGLGILLFSGSLYVLSLNELLNAPGLKIMGAITPCGGILFISGWLCLAREAWVSR